MALNVKKGDTVVVIAGKDKGKTGKVLVAMPADNSVVVAGVNIISKHKKPRSAQDKGALSKRKTKLTLVMFKSFVLLVVKLLELLTTWLTAKRLVLAKNVVLA